MQQMGKRSHRVVTVKEQRTICRVTEPDELPEPGELPVTDDYFLT